MSSPNDPRPTDDTVVRTPPATQEIPVAAPAVAPQLPPHPGATTPAPVHSLPPTGPVGVVPGLPGPLPPAPSPAAAPAAPAASGSSAAHEPSAGRPDGTAVLPGAAPPATEPPRTAPLRDRATLLGLGLVLAALVLLELGLGLRFGGASFWSELPLWSAFATVCTVLGLAASAASLPGGGRWSPSTGRRIAVGGLAGLAVFWLLVVLPVVAGDRGFLLTAALGCLGAALWFSPGRKG